MTTRYYDLSENVVPHQNGEAISDTPAAQSPSETTDQKRNDGDITDPTSLDSNPKTEDGERTPDSRTDVTSLAARRAEAKRPKISHQDFSNVCKFIDRTSNANPQVDFGRVVVHAVREYSQRANRNALTVLAAVVPILISSGNFDIADRDSLISLNNEIRQAASKKGDASSPSKESPPGGDSGSAQMSSSDAAEAQAGVDAGQAAVGDQLSGGGSDGGGIPSDPGGVGGALNDMLGGGSGPDSGVSQGLGDMGSPGQGLFNSPTGPAGSHFDPTSEMMGGLSDPSGGGAPPMDAAGGGQTSPLGLAPPGGANTQALGTDPNAQINLAQRRQSIPADPGGVGGMLSDVAGGVSDAVGGVAGQMGADAGEGLDSTLNNLKQDATQELGGALGIPGGQSGQDFGADLSNGLGNTVTNMGEDLKQDTSNALGLSTPGTGLHNPLSHVRQGNDTPAGPADTNDVDPNAAGGGTAANPGSAIANPTPPANPAGPVEVNRGRTFMVARGRSRFANGLLHFDTGGPEAPVPVTHVQDHGDGTSLIHNEAGQPEAVNNEDLYHDQQMSQPVTQQHPREQLPETSPQKKKDDGPPRQQAPPPPPNQQQQYQNPNKSSRRASGDTNADGADPEDAREENKDNTVNPNDSFTRDPGEDLSDNTKSSALSRHADFPNDNLDAAKRDTDTQDPEKPVANTTSDDAQSSQYDRGKYDQNGPLLTDPDKSTDQNWPPKASAVDAIRLADMYVDFGLISPEQKYQVVAGFEKMNSFIVKDRLKVLTAVASVKRPERNRALVPQAANHGNMPSMQQGTSLKNASRNNGADLDHFLAL